MGFIESLRNFYKYVTKEDRDLNLREDEILFRMAWFTGDFNTINSYLSYRVPCEVRVNHMIENHYIRFNRGINGPEFEGIKSL